MTAPGRSLSRWLITRAKNRILSFYALASRKLHTTNWSSAFGRRGGMQAEHVLPRGHAGCWVSAFRVRRWVLGPQELDEWFLLIFLYNFFCRFLLKWGIKKMSVKNDKGGHVLYTFWVPKSFGFPDSRLREALCLCYLESHSQLRQKTWDQQCPQSCTLGPDPQTLTPYWKGQTALKLSPDARLLSRLHQTFTLPLPQKSHFW